MSSRAAAEPVPGARPIRTTCPYCGVGCGVLATPDDRGGVRIAGDPDHPANFGRLCSKGSALGETLGLETRLLTPVLDGKTASWNAALDAIATRLATVRSTFGPDSIAFYLSGQLLTEDYYVANKLAKGFLGTPHVDTNSRLCMASSVAGHRRAFGADVVPQCYDDLEMADLVVLIGSNAAWCHPILYQRIQIARGERGMRVVNIDPRRTATSEGSDLQLSIRPGTDTVLFSGLLVRIADRGLADGAFVEAHTEGFADAVVAARALAPTVAAVATATGLDAADIELFYTWWCRTPRVVTCYSQGVNQSAQGTDKVNAIINCHLATGRIGRTGSGPLSLTGQPNAMGGREVGGLANMLAAHMGFSPEERDRVARFWSAPSLVGGEGKKAVAMFDAIAAGEIKALWVMGTNPAVSLPRADAVRKALGRLDLLVVSENVASNDTLASAHIRLPAAAWGEKDGTVTNSERRISRQRPFLPVAGEAKPDWWIMSEVARRLGWGDAFAYSTVDQVFDEHARLSGFENAGERAFDISGLAGLDTAAYDALTPVQWPVRLEVGRTADSQGSATLGTKRLFADGRFFTPGRRGRLIAVAAPALAAATGERYPFILNTGRIRDQWHTMTRTGLSPRLMTHIPEPYVEIHPEDATRLGLEQGRLARVETAHGAATLRVLLSKGQMPGTLFVPIHWSGENSSSGRTGALVHPFTDPISGQPEAKSTPAVIAPAAAALYGFALSRTPIATTGHAYWASARAALGSSTGQLLNFALDAVPDDVGEWQRTLLPSGDWATLEDAAGGTYRTAVFRDDRLEAVLFLAPQPKLPAIDWLKARFGDERVAPEDRRAILAGQPFTGSVDEGPIVCVCYQVGARRIAAAVEEGCASTRDIGQKLGAGTNCGSCLPEIKRIIASVPRRQDAAE